MEDEERGFIQALSCLSPSKVIRSKALLRHFLQFFTRGHLQDSQALIEHSLAVISQPPQPLLQPLQLLQPIQPIQPIRPIQSLQPQLQQYPLCSLPLPFPIQSHTQTALQQLQSLPEHQKTAPQSRRRRNPARKPRKIPQNASATETTAWEYFKKERPKKLQSTVKAAVLFAQSRPLSDEEHKTLWVSKESGKTVRVFTSSFLQHKVRRLEQGKLYVDRNQRVNACRSRVQALFTHHEISEYAHSAPEGVGRRDVYASREYSKVSQKEIPYINNELARSRNYLYLLELSGPGDVIRLDEGGLSSWKNELVKPDIERIVQFRDDRFPVSEEESQRLNIIGATAIITGFIEYGWTYAELAECQGKVMRVLFKYIDKEELAGGNIVPRRLDGNVPGYNGIPSSEGELNEPSRPTGNDSLNEGSAEGSQSSSSLPDDGSEGDISDHEARFEDSSMDSSETSGFYTSPLDTAGPPRMNDGSKRPCPADNGEEYQCSQRRRQNRGNEDNAPGAAVDCEGDSYPTGSVPASRSGETEATSNASRNSLESTQRPCQQGDATRQSLRNALPAAQRNTGELYPNSAFAIDPAALNNLAQSPNRTIVPTDINTDAHINDPFFGASPSLPDFDINSAGPAQSNNNAGSYYCNLENIQCYGYDNGSDSDFDDSDEAPFCDFEINY